ncbi:hypothetical protein RYA05_05395 [Pseudomonas syringae pv. actinidiae]|nr:hypothetical protein [Pseudomonas syringae pv. actinidiae]
MLAPNHCFVEKNDLYVHNFSNPILAKRITQAKQVDNFDLALIRNTPLLPPTGEYSQGGLSCSSIPMADHRFAHSCSKLEKGDSGSVIRNGSFIGMHLGIIKINGITFGFGLDYRAIINDIKRNDIN